jgi:type II secretory pathway pseudopilin PulG
MDSKSFTLLELIVSVSIIVGVIIVVVGIYIYTIGPQQKLIAKTNLQQDGQLIFNLLAKDIRTYHWNYGSFCVTNPLYFVSLIDESTNPNILIKYRRCKWQGSPPTISNCDVGETNCFLAKCVSPTCSDDCDSSYKQISMSDNYVTKFEIYLQPLCNPYSSESKEYQNPQVTILLEMKSYRRKFGEQWLKIQETIPQRYQEKSQF